MKGSPGAAVIRNARAPGPQGGALDANSPPSHSQSYLFVVSGSLKRQVSGCVALFESIFPQKLLHLAINPADSGRTGGSGERPESFLRVCRAAEHGYVRHPQRRETRGRTAGQHPGQEISRPRGGEFEACRQRTDPSGSRPITKRLRGITCNSPRKKNRLPSSGDVKYVPARRAVAGVR